MLSSNIENIGMNGKTTLPALGKMDLLSEIIKDVRRKREEILEKDTLESANKIHDFFVRDRDSYQPTLYKKVFEMKTLKLPTTTNDKNNDYYSEEDEERGYTADTLINEGHDKEIADTDSSGTNNSDDDNFDATVSEIDNDTSFLDDIDSDSDSFQLMVENDDDSSIHSFECDGLGTESDLEEDYDYENLKEQDEDLNTNDMPNEIVTGTNKMLPSFNEHETDTDGTLDDENDNNGCESISMQIRKYSHAVSLKCAFAQSMISHEALGKWDNKMGLKRSHSKCMTKSIQSRKKLRFMLDEVKIKF